MVYEQHHARYSERDAAVGIDPLARLPSRIFQGREQIPSQSRRAAVRRAHMNVNFHATSSEKTSEFRLLEVG
jgi:hypothetical protein